MKEDYEDSTVESWVMSKCDQWRDHYETNYSERFDEYYRTWRGIWDKSDSMRDSERSRLIAPATQQAVESSVAEIEEATFGRGAFFDIKDDLQDPNPSDVEILKLQLTEDMHFSKARSSIGECLINSAVFGTGIGELVLDEMVELTAATQPALEGQMTAVGVNKRDRMIVRLDPIMPQNFLIDPLATNVEDAVGVAIDKMVPHHQVQQSIDAGIYRDVDISRVQSESEIEDASKIVYGYNDDMVRLTKYYGLVPTELLKNQELDENEELQDMVDLDDEEGSYTEVIMVIANESEILKIEKNPYMKKDRPVIAFSWDKVPFKFWGRGICEKGYNSQKALDAELRARIDALALTVHPMLAVDASRMPRGAKLDIRPGKTILTNGNPAEVLQPFKFGAIDQVTFSQAAQLQQMVQQSTGAIDSNGVPAGLNGEGTAAGISMGLGAVIKRHKRTLVNFQENFLIPFIEKAACRYMQFTPELYPVKDYKFVATSSLGVVAREYEVTQLVQLLQTMSPESPAYPLLIESIVSNMSLTNRDQIIQVLRQANQPNPQQQQEAQVRQQMELEVAMSSLEKLKTETAEIASRIQQNNVETQLLPIEEETRRISALASAQPKDKTEFDKLVEYAKLELKEAELDTKENIVRLQMQENKNSA
tara:strand:+ start:1969 stop:3918 length:1950 start_codon:yes stop_codon:yes gene_type:complete